MAATTIKDIASRSNVSHMTVSRVLRGDTQGLVAEPTRKRVLRFAKELGYRANVGARGLTLGKSFLIGVLHSGVNYELVPDLSGGIQHALTLEGYAPIVLTHRSSEEELRCLDICLARRVDGLIVNMALREDGSSNRDRMLEVCDGGLPMVELNGRFLERVPSVVADFREMGRQATEGLLQRGHRSIALYIHDHYRDSAELPTCGAYWTAWEATMGYEQAMRAAGLVPQISTYGIPSDLNAPGSAFDAGQLSAARLLERKNAPTGVVCFSDEPAMALAGHAAMQGKLNLEIACVGTGLVANRFRSVVVSKRLPGERIGETAAQMVLDLIAGRAVTSQKLGSSEECDVRSNQGVKRSSAEWQAASAKVSNLEVL